MKLEPRFLYNLDKAAQVYQEGSFFAVRNDREIFLTNWVLGLCFDQKEISRPLLHTLMDRADLCAQNEVQQIVIYHIAKRGWRDILLGPGTYRAAHPERLTKKEASAFEKRAWPMLAFETQFNARYFVRHLYLECVQALLTSVDYAIFHPQSKDVPANYNPLLFLDMQGKTKGLTYAITPHNLWNPIDKNYEIRTYLENEVFVE